MSALQATEVVVPLPRRLVTHQATRERRPQAARPSVVPPSPVTSCDLVTIDPRMRHDVERWVERYVQAALEIIAGDRPAGQLTRWTTHEVHQDLVRRSLLVARAGAHEPGRGRRQGLTRPSVHQVSLSFWEVGVVEAAIHVKHGNRSRAVAGRFEAVQGRWHCTALEFC